MASIDDIITEAKKLESARDRIAALQRERDDHVSKIAAIDLEIAKLGGERDAAVVKIKDKAGKA